MNSRSIITIPTFSRTGFRIHRMSRWPIVVAVLLLCAVIPAYVSPRQTGMLTALMIAGAGLIVLMRWPPVGIVGLVVVALIAPSPELPGGINVAVLFLLLLILLWIFGMVVNHRVALAPSRTNRPILALIGVTILAFGAGQLPFFSNAPKAPLTAQFGGMMIFLLAAGAFLLSANQITDLKWLQWTTWTFLFIGSIDVAGWIVPELVHGLNNRLLQPGTTNNSIFWLWLVALSLSQALYNKKLHIVWRVLLFGFLLATMYKSAVLNNDWKSGYLPSFVAIGVIIGARSWSLGALVARLGIIPAKLVSSQAISTDQFSYTTRLDAWIVVFRMIRYSPVVGFGPSNYPFYTRFFPMHGWRLTFNSHNQYLDIIAQIGFLGLGCVLWFAWQAGSLGWSLRRRAPVGFAQAYVYGALGGLAGMLAAGFLVDWFLPLVYNVGMVGFRASMLTWIFLGGLVAVEQITRRQPEAEPANTDC